MPHRRVLALVTVLLLPAGCSGSAQDDAAASPSAPTSTSTSPSTSTSTSASAPGTASSPAVRPSRVTGTRVVADDLPTPWGLARLPDGSHLVSLRDEARVVRVSDTGEVTRVPGTGAQGRVAGVEPSGEGGLLGLALAPDDPRTLYAYLTSADDNRVVRMSYVDGRLGAPQLVLGAIPKAGNHNGGRLAFGPDGFLYVTTGDAGQTGRAQDKGSLGGKILRITVAGEPAPGNPFPGSPVWSYGHRNVQGLGWDTDGTMYASEFGQNTFDELNRIEPGKNYGWPDVEGMGTKADESRGFTRPLRTWATSDSSPSGLAVGLGSVWMAALRGKRLWRIPLAPSAPTGVGEPAALLAGDLGRLRAVEVEPDGSLLVLTDNVSHGGARDGDDKLVSVRLS